MDAIEPKHKIQISFETTYCRRDLTRTPKQANPSLVPNGGGASSVDTSQASISFVNGNTSFNASKVRSFVAVPIDLSFCTNFVRKDKASHPRG